MAWTTLEDEAAVLDQLTETGRVAIDVLGQSVQGRPIRLLRIGDPPPPPHQRAAVLLVGSQHGDEPAGREAMIALAVDLANGNLPAYEGLLGTRGVHIIPTPNPDGIANGVRENSNGRDINRGWMALEQPENRAIGRALGRLRPLLLVDHHEADPQLSANVKFAPPTVPEADQAVKDRSSELIVAAKAAMTDNGWTHGDYTSTVRGEPNRLVNNAGMRHTVAMLVETSVSQMDTVRVAQHRECALVTMSYFADEMPGLEQDVSAAEQRAAAAGASGAAFDLNNGIILDPAPLGYQLSGVLPEAHLAAFGILTISGARVSMAQPARAAIGLLFDPDSSHVIAPSVRLFTLPTPGVVATVQELAPVVAGSHRMVVEAYVLREFASGDNPGGEPIPILGGQVVMDGTADVQRTLNLVTGGVDFPRRIGDLLLPDGTEVFVRRGVDIGSDVLWAPLGYYRIEEPDQDDAPDGPIVIRAFDRMQGIITSPLLSPRQFGSSTTFGEVFSSLVSDVYPTAVIAWDDDTEHEPIGRTLIVERSRYEPLRTLAESRGKILYWDGRGILRVETAPDPSEPLWEVRAGRDGVLSRARRRITRTDVVNAVVVRSQASRDLGPARAVAIDDGPLSITRFGGRFGAVPAHITVPVETTVEQARQAARDTLLRRAGLPFQVEVEAVVNPALKPFDPFRVTLRNGERERHVAERITLPLTAQGVMRIASREQRGSLVRVVQQ